MTAKSDCRALLQKFRQSTDTFWLVRNGKIELRSRAAGIKTLSRFAISNKPLAKYVVYDKIIGNPAAVLLIHLKAKKIRTPLISFPALKKLLKKKIEVVYLKKSEFIYERNKQEMCEIEKRLKMAGEKKFLQNILKKK
ncbi:DUF1893 domain-containing protein [Candidatus Parcubacteria bacterium]|nr:MAG: DUF1893 domain-containing protein [Candidatus Parcubacteria bacterium]